MPELLKFRVAQNEPYLTVKEFSIRNCGSGTLNWQIDSNKSWLGLSQLSGSLAAGQWQTVNVTVDPTGFPLGTVSGALTVSDTLGISRTRTVGVLANVGNLLNVGGGDADQGNVSGIHWHMNLSNKIEFISPDEGESIPWVRMTDASGKVTEFKTSDFTGDPAAHAIHTMDCMDCHNRPAHKFLSPNDAVNRSMAQGRIDPTMPWVKKNAVEALTQDYSDKDQALQKIGASLRKEYPGDKRTDNLVQEVQGIYQRNFFPEMKSDWLTYPDHLSHKNWAGCFRCHDGDHEAADESTIKASDCTTCHIILAQGSTEEEMQTLSAKGLDFLHIDFEYEDFDCADCHTGANMEEDEEEEDEEEEEDDEGDE